MEKVTFDASEIYQFAIRIEENGERFYRKVAESVSENDMKELFTFLAGEEVTHRRFFEQTVGSLQPYQPEESFPDEYFSYLRAYADQIVFPPEAERELAGKKGVGAALEFGIRRELDSIAYYREMMNFIPPDQRKMILTIIEQERNHFVRLSHMKARIQQGGTRA